MDDCDIKENSFLNVTYKKKEVFHEEKKDLFEKKKEERETLCKVTCDDIKLDINTTEKDRDEWEKQSHDNNFLNVNYMGEENIKWTSTTTPNCYDENELAEELVSGLLEKLTTIGKEPRFRKTIKLMIEHNESKRETEKVKQQTWNIFWKLTQEKEILERDIKG